MEGLESVTRARQAQLRGDGGKGEASPAQGKDVLVAAAPRPRA